MTFVENRIYLASRSPRRQELLKQIGVDFMVLPLREALARIPDVDETPLPQESPPEYVERIARVKAETGRKRMSERGWADFPVLGADTAVVSNGRIFGKPENPLHAKQMLGALSGQLHEVLTAAAVAAGNGTRVCLSRSSVRFRNLSEQEIGHYLACGEAYDKAGAYAIQEWIGAVGIESINGCFYNVMGLPISNVVEALQKI